MTMRTRSKGISSHDDVSSELSCSDLTDSKGSSPESKVDQQNHQPPGEYANGQSRPDESVQPSVSATDVDSVSQCVSQQIASRLCSEGKDGKNLLPPPGLSTSNPCDNRMMEQSRQSSARQNTPRSISESSTRAQGASPRSPLYVQPP